MEIVLSPDPMLREICSPVALPIDRDTKKLAKQMAKDMYKNEGCGLAAPQVGVLKRLVVLDCDTEEGGYGLLTLVNPEIVAHSDETWKGSEGCLSLPGINCDIDRWTEVTVRFFDLNGNECEITANADEEPLLTRCFQHEIDHLDGKTLFERLSPIERINKLKEYQAALEAGARPGMTEI